MTLAIPELALVVLIGPSGAGKSTFARRHFKATEIVSSDACRGLVADDENDLSATGDAFDLVHFIAGKRLAAGRLTVIDATSVRADDRRPLVEIARQSHCLPVAIVFDLPERLCQERNAARPDRDFGPHVIRGQRAAMRRGLKYLRREGFRHVFTFKSPEEVDAAVIEREPLWNNLKSDHGPFDIIGDVHGCYDELFELLALLGYRVEADSPQRHGDTEKTGSERDGSALVDGCGVRTPNGSEGPWETEGAPCSRPVASAPGSDPGSDAAPCLASAAQSATPTHIPSARLKHRVQVPNPKLVVSPPAGRKLVFVGDLVDRGPKIAQVLRLVMSMVADGHALCVPGNHDVKLMRKLMGRDVQISHGLAESLHQLDQETAEFRLQVAHFIDDLVSHYVLDDGKLVVAHAGMKEEMQGRGSGKVREFALFGETTGETDEFGLPVRYNWAAEYRGNAHVVYGHTPVPSPEWLNRTINIDTGCVFGGKLTALRYPEMELVSVPAKRTYAEPRKPFLPADATQQVRASNWGGESAALMASTQEAKRVGADSAESVAVQADVVRVHASSGTVRSHVPTFPPSHAPLSAQQQHDDLLDIADLTGKRIISTRLMHNVTIFESQSAAALEVMSRFAINPKWLIYLPPTMSPCETAREGELLEHPREAFAYYRGEGQPRVVCEEKHMGSRAVVVVCRDEGTALRRLGVVGEGFGAIYTRTGRRFFDDATRETELLVRIRDAIAAAGLWDEFDTDWMCLDCELMPWSAKAQALLQEQYAAVGAAARAALPQVTAALQSARETGLDTAALLEQARQRNALGAQFVAAYQRYCWPVDSVDDLKLAPFHVLASEGRVHANRDHVWHMDTLARLCAADGGVLLATPYRVVDLTDPDSERGGVEWWEELTARGGEGMVVKPLDFIARGPRGVTQPAVKCRGREYLRIIYGPEYTLPENLERLRSRGLARKRGLAMREFALGIESLDRFVRGEPLRRVHECVFGVLALESEPVDPRL